MKKLIILNISIISVLYYIKLSNDNLDSIHPIHDIKSIFYTRRLPTIQEKQNCNEWREWSPSSIATEIPEEALEQTTADFTRSENPQEELSSTGDLSAPPNHDSLVGLPQDPFQKSQVDEMNPNSTMGDLDSFTESNISDPVITESPHHTISDTDSLLAEGSSSTTETVPDDRNAMIAEAPTLENLEKMDPAMEETSLQIASQNEQAIPIQESLQQEPAPSHFDSSPPIAAALTDSTVMSIFRPSKAIPPLAAKNSSSSSPKPQKSNPYPTPKRVAISHTEGCGNHEYKFGTNYSLLEILLSPDARQNRFLPMIDLRGYRFDNGTYALSSGFVGRYVPNQNNFCELLGFSVYYDYRNAPYGYSNQMGGGVEVLGKRWDFRANLYAPFGKNHHLGKCCHLDCINGWFGFGYNAEIGYLAVRSKSFLLYTAIGPYYITARKCDERQRGGMIRIVPQYKDYLALNMKFSYDPIFKSIFQAELIISLPLYQISVPEKGPCGITNRQIYQRVERRF